MLRPSFSLTLLASFLLIAGVLGAAAASGWMALEQFAREGRERSAAAITLNASVQQLAERSVDLERSARQYLVLEDEAIRERFFAARDEALRALTRIEQLDPALAPLADAWRQHAGNIVLAVGRELAGPPLPAATASPGSAETLLALSGINEQLAAEARAHVARDERALLDTLDARRKQLTAQILGAVAIAMALAALTGWWLLRPLRRIEKAIAALGDSQLTQVIEVDGPADLRRVGQQLDWLRLRLTELEAHRNRVLRHVSHELKTPLASLREGVSLLADGVLGRLTPEQREVSAILEHNTRALQERIEQLLHYNATQFDARRLELRATALLPLVRETVAELQLQTQARGIRIDIDGEAPLVQADAGKLRIALSNLLANAIGFSPAGDRIRIELARDGETVLIDCIDSGPGIATAELERIFEPFFQGSQPDQRSAKGSGLGLAIVREFIAAHGGKVFALPAERGAHFRIELPHAT
ncbi:HAMP domain-containing sensor histidine kinase [Thauera sp. 63]|uniref:HAMP domain-containing sensor histidine kinase n=1 Tax=Thauera sp. 63 TaxID=497321 RepID=UPI0002CDA07D|nr:ATP-binding protein [Thauera sp. 63]ENO77882.1 sensory transduction histidine kinase [Thauera sp. 63]